MRNYDIALKLMQETESVLNNLIAYTESKATSNYYNTKIDEKEITDTDIAYLQTVRKEVDICAQRVTELAQSETSISLRKMSNQIHKIETILLDAADSMTANAAYMLYQYFDYFRDRNTVLIDRIRKRI